MFPVKMSISHLRKAALWWMVYLTFDLSDMKDGRSVSPGVPGEDQLQSKLREPVQSREDESSLPMLPDLRRGERATRDFGEVTRSGEVRPVIFPEQCKGPLLPATIPAGTITSQLAFVDHVSPSNFSLWVRTSLLSSSIR